MKSILSHICISALLLAATLPAMAQKSKEKRDVPVPEMSTSATMNIQQQDNHSIDSAFAPTDSLKMANIDHIVKQPKKTRDWSTWRPDTKRALWLALVLPGAGQIYNHKYWKLPIIYGGFVGCAYAITWNNQMYHDYSQAYMDIMDNDPNTQSYNQFLHLGAQINASNIDRYKDIFKKRKDKYRRWRDMGMFVMIGVYALSVIDAYVDASLSEFDISDDLSLHIEPTMMGGAPYERNPWKSQSIGLSCALTF